MYVFCIDCINIDLHSIECIRNTYDLCRQCQHTYHLMVCLKSPKSPLSKTFLGLKIGWILRKLWAEMCMCFVSTVSTYIALNALHTLILCLDSVNIHSIQNTLCISCFDPLYQVSRHETEVIASFYVHTDKVTMSGFFIIWFEVGLSLLQRVKSKTATIQTIKLN